MSSGVEQNETKGELKLQGRRYMVMSMDALCNHLDTLVGNKVAEVIIKKLEFQEGKVEAERFYRDHPNAKIEEFINHMIRYDSLTGVGITSVKLSNNPGPYAAIQISNPYIKRTEGSSKSLLFSWWCGALSYALNRELDIESISYDAASDILTCTLSCRATQ
jgi:hypothetical protein